MSLRHPMELDSAAAKIFLANERMNQMLIDCLDSAVWNSKAPGNTRSIVAIFTHMHNVRCKWIRLTAPHLKVPAKLERTQCSKPQAQKSLGQSAARCAEMLEEALGSGERRIKKFRRDGWGKPWPVGAEMLCYMLAHEAHHRGQICMLAHQLGFRLPPRVTSDLWNWEKLWKECGFAGGPGHPTP